MISRLPLLDFNKLLHLAFDKRMKCCHYLSSLIFNLTGGNPLCQPLNKKSKIKEMHSKEDAQLCKT